MSTFGEITTTDLNLWQFRALRVLTEISEAAVKAERYPLDWTITTNGSLVGEVHRYAPKQTDSDRRAVFEEWCRVLEASAPRESKRFAGGTEFRAFFKRSTNRGEVQGSLLLTIDAPANEA